jgi:hypothetical protein
MLQIIKLSVARKTSINIEKKRWDTNKGLWEKGKPQVYALPLKQVFFPCHDGMIALCPSWWKSKGL